VNILKKGASLISTEENKALSMRYWDGSTRGQGRRCFVNTTRALGRIGWWLLWVVMSTVGFVIAGVIGHFPFGFSVGDDANLTVENAVVGFVFGAVTGTIIGALQFVVLRSLLQRLVSRRFAFRAGWWVLATAVGVGVTHAIGDAAPSPVTYAMLAVLAGAVVGILQWVVLRRLVKRAGWWVIASIVGWFVGLIVGMFLANSAGLTTSTGLEDWRTQHAIVGLVAGVVSGAITGIMLVWLFRSPVSEAAVREPPSPLPSP
jgi:hypothetical protein